MDIEVIKKLIDSSRVDHKKLVESAEVAERYYTNENDILKYRSPSNKNQNSTDNPMRVADNRIPYNYHGLLVNQKAAYMATYPPMFDVGDKDTNEVISDILGDNYQREAKTLTVNADNCGTAWLHVWIDENNQFQYANVDPKQVIAVYSNDLKKRLIAILRTYEALDNEGNKQTVYEYWTDKECYRFASKDGGTLSLKAFNSFTKTDIDTGNTEAVNVYQHNFEEVPFIEFPNNGFKKSVLNNTKRLIDVYDKVSSGFVNDIEDIQELIFVLTNYGGADLDEFLGDLKRYKAIKMESDGAGDHSGINTLAIDIPVDARNKLLELTREAIFEQGQGIDPRKQDFGNASGVSLKFVYSLLELKTGLTETEFRPGYARLVRMICKHLGKKVDKITQTWTRNMITNDSETADIAMKSMGVISRETILANHPWVDDVERELERIKKEEPEVEIYPGLLRDPEEDDE